MESDKLKKAKKLLEFEQKFKVNPVVAILSENEKVISGISDELNTIKDDSEKIVGAINQLDQVKADKVELERAVASVEMRKGDRGFKGEKGDKGEAGNDGKNGVDGKDGLNGIDGRDGKDGLDGEKGADGKDGKDGGNETGKQTIQKINDDPKELIKRKKIEGGSDLVDNDLMNRAIGIVDNRTSFLINKTTGLQKRIELLEFDDANLDDLQGVTERGATTTIHSTFKDGLTVNSNKRIYLDGN